MLNTAQVTPMPRAKATMARVVTNRERSSVRAAKRTSRTRRNIAEPPAPLDGTGDVGVGPAVQILPSPRNLHCGGNMRRLALVSIAAALAPTLVSAQLTTPTDWKWRQDAAAPLAAGLQMKPGEWTFVQMPPGWHVTTGPGVLLYPATNGDVAGQLFARIGDLPLRRREHRRIRHLSGWTGYRGRRARRTTPPSCSAVTARQLCCGNAPARRPPLRRGKARFHRPGQERGRTGQERPQGRPRSRVCHLVGQRHEGPERSAD